jgi:hypothetical protein
MPRPAPRPALRRRLVACAASVACAAASLAPAAAAAQPGPPPASLPDSPLGRIAGRFLDAVNAGDSAAVARFVAEHVAPSAMPGGDAATRARTLALLARQSGGLTLERARMSGSALRVFARARAVPRVLGVELVPAPGDTARVADLGLYPMDPAMMGPPPAPWAEGALGDDSLAAVVRRRVREAAAADGFAGVVLVARGDRVLVHEALGFADRERRLPNTTRRSSTRRPSGRCSPASRSPSSSARGGSRSTTRSPACCPTIPTATRRGAPPSGSSSRTPPARPSRSWRRASAPSRPARRTTRSWRPSPTRRPRSRPARATSTATGTTPRSRRSSSG